MAEYGYTYQKKREVFIETLKSVTDFGQGLLLQYLEFIQVYFGFTPNHLSLIANSNFQEIKDALNYYEQARISGLGSVFSFFQFSPNGLS